MRLSLTELYERLDPWELTIVVGDETVRVRRLSNADMRQVSAMLGGRAKPADVERIVLGLFEEPCPAVAAWDTLKLGIVLTAIVEYFRKEVVQKKIADVAGVVATQIKAAHGATSGTSS